MEKTIYITESQSRMLESILKEEEEEVTFTSFMNSIKTFLSQLLTNPTNPSVPEFFTERGISKQELLDKVVGSGIANEKTSVDDKGEHAKVGLKYSIPKSGFRTRVEKLYDQLITNKKQINEEGEGGAGAVSGGDAGGGSFLSGGESATPDTTAHSAQGSGQYIGKAFLGKKKKDTDVMSRTYA